MNDLSTMTPAQSKRFAELMLRDMLMSLNNVAPISPTGNLRDSIGIAQTPFGTFVSAKEQSVDEMLNRIENEQNKRIQRAEMEHRAKIDKALSREELFRFAYVPFVIAELVWDYADTVLCLAHGIHETRKLCRAIKNARKEYDTLRRQYIDENNRKREIENMYVFEDGVNRITRQMLLNIDIDIKSEYPDLLPESRDLLVAVYQCHVLSRALITYTNREAVKLEKRLNQRVGNILPPTYYVMDKLIPEFFGDKPASDRLKNLIAQYIKSLSVQIGLVELNDISDDENKSNYHFSK